MTRTQQHRSTVSVADAIRATVNPAHLKCEPWASIIARAEALEALVPVAEAILYHSDSGRTETRWTAKDGLANAGDIANCDNLRAALARVREAK